MTTDMKCWGPWRLHDHEALGPILEREWDDSARHYWIELRRCTSSAEVLDAIMHTSGYSWCGGHDDALAGLVRGLREVLDPVSNLCSWGKSKTLRPRRLDQILAQAVTR